MSLSATPSNTADGHVMGREQTRTSLEVKDKLIWASD